MHKLAQASVDELCLSKIFMRKKEKKMKMDILADFFLVSCVLEGAFAGIIVPC